MVIRLNRADGAQQPPCRKMVGRLAMFSFDNPYRVEEEGHLCMGREGQSRALKQRFRYARRPFTGSASAEVNSLMSPMVSVR